jgi:hypothetical protein
MLCGDPGTGKTTLLRRIEALDASTHRVVFVPFLHVPADQVAPFLLGWMGYRQHDGDAELRTLLETGDRPTLLLIDEAQSISPDAAARLRAVVSATRADVQIVLAGVPSPELDATLAALGEDCVRLDLESQRSRRASPRRALAAVSAPAAASNPDPVAGTAPSPQHQTLSEPTATAARPHRELCLPGHPTAAHAGWAWDVWPRAAGWWLRARARSSGRTQHRLSNIRSRMADGLSPALLSIRDGSARIWRWTDDRLAVGVEWIVANARTASRHVADAAHASAPRWNAALQALRTALSNGAAAAREGLGRATDRARDAAIQVGRSLRRQRETIARRIAIPGPTLLLVTGVLLGLGGLVIATILAGWMPTARNVAGAQLAAAQPEAPTAHATVPALSAVRVAPPPDLAAFAAPTESNPGAPPVRARVASAVRPLALDAESLPAPRVQSTEEGQGLVEVNINALPWAHVRVDGRELGTTPLGAVGLDVGLREFELRFPGGRSVTYAVEIDPTVLYLSFGADRAPIVTAEGDRSP